MTALPGLNLQMGARHNHDTTRTDGRSPAFLRLELYFGSLQSWLTQ